MLAARRVTVQGLAHYCSTKTKKLNVTPDTPAADARYDTLTSRARAREPVPAPSLNSMGHPAVLTKSARAGFLAVCSAPHPRVTIPKDRPPVGHAAVVSHST